MSRCPRIAACLLFALVSPLSCFAYGGWKSETTLGRVKETLPFLIRHTGFALIPYIVCSYLMEKLTGWRRVFPLLLAPFLWAIDVSIVSGEYGPAHAAIEAEPYVLWILPVALIAKMIRLIKAENQRATSGVGSQI